MGLPTSIISFSEYSVGTTNPIYTYGNVTVSFAGKIVNDGSQPKSPAIACNENYNGPVSWTFSQPVASIEFDAGYFNSIGSTVARFYNASGALLQSITNSTYGVQHFAYASASGISKVIVTPVAADANGFSVDSLAFGAQASSYVARTGNPDVDGVLWGYKWSNTHLTYSFPVGTAEYTDAGYAAIQGFETFNPTQQQAALAVFANISSFCGLTFTPATGNTVANIRLAEATKLDYGGIDAKLHQPGFDRPTAEGNPPDPQFNQYQFGDAWFSHGVYETPVTGTYEYTAGIMHEIGHTLGLKHGHQAPTLPADHNSFEYSVMTYAAYVGANTDLGIRAHELPTTFMQDDIAALQYMYGANFSYNSGNTVYHFSPADPFIFQTIWDGGGIDEYDLSAYSTPVSIDLRPGAWTITSSQQLADLGDGHRARGNVANALLYNGNPASLIENATGGSGNDWIEGNDIANVLNGGAGNDWIFGYAANDTIIGGYGSDWLDGGAGDDWIDAGTGNDWIDGGAGNDTINGSSGMDTAMYGSNRAQFGITVSGEVVTIYGAGTDRLTGVERAEFNDSILAFDIQGNAGNAYRLYQAAFNRTPDTPGLSFWTHALDRGTDILTVARGFVESSEFRSIYGVQPSNASIVDHLYYNVLHRAGDAEGVAFWTRGLENGLPIADLLQGFAVSSENHSLVDPKIAQGIVLDTSAFLV
jgi:Ca2+-binding RTX toxin-like protein